MDVPENFRGWLVYVMYVYVYVNKQLLVWKQHGEREKKQPAFL